MRFRVAPIVMLVLTTATLAGCMDDDDDHDHHAPTYAPVPESAYGPPIPEAGYLVQEISDGVYWLTDGLYQVMFLTTGEGVILVDAPPNLGAYILPGIASVTEEPLTHLIYSHSHADHVAAAASLGDDLIIIAHEAAAAALAGDHTSEPEVPFGTFVGGAPVPAPTMTFSDSMTLEVGTQTLELHDMGPAHEEGNLFVYAPAQKVLLVIDVFFPGWVPFMGLALAEDVPAYLAAHDAALSFEFETLVAGHLGRLGTRADVEMQKEYFQDVKANSLAALQSVDFNAIAADVGFENAWLLFGTYLHDVAAECASLTEAKWVGVLAGADIFTESHCDRIVESIRID